MKKLIVLITLIFISGCVAIEDYDRRHGHGNYIRVKDKVAPIIIIHNHIKCSKIKHKVVRKSIKLKPIKSKNRYKAKSIIKYKHYKIFNY